MECAELQSCHVTNANYKLTDGDKLGGSWATFPWKQGQCLLFLGIQQRATTPDF